MTKGWWSWLGRIRYGPAWELQKRLHGARLEGRIPDLLLLLEHEPVITLSPAHDPRHLLRTPDEYERLGIELHRTDRGGDVTYHGPGQLVGYPIFDLRERGRDLHRYLRDVEEAVIRCLAAFGVEARRNPPNTGVWVGDEKLCAIGIKVSRWVSLHGFALNVDNDLSPFAHIVPCGLSGLGVNSIAGVIGTGPGMERARAETVRAFGGVFGKEFEEVGVERLAA